MRVKDMTMNPGDDNFDDQGKDSVAYFRDLNAVRRKLRIAEEQSARGEARPLDIEEVKREVRKRLAAVGIV